MTYTRFTRGDKPTIYIDRTPRLCRGSGDAIRWRPVWLAGSRFVVPGCRGCSTVPVGFKGLMVKRHRRVA